MELGSHVLPDESVNGDEVAIVFGMDAGSQQAEVGNEPHGSSALFTSFLETNCQHAMKHERLKVVQM